MEFSQCEFLRKLGKEICTARKQLKMSQAGLTEKADLSVTYISKIECGHRNFSVHTMAKIAQVLKLPQYKIIEVTCFEKYNELLKKILEEYSSDEIEDIVQILQSINEVIVKRPLK